MEIPTPHERIAITGMAMCNALGRHVDDIWPRTLAMHSGIRALQPHPDDPPAFTTPPFVPGLSSYCDILASCDLQISRQELGLPPQDFQAMSASARRTLLVAGQALKASGLAEAGYAPERVGVFVSQNAGEAASTLWDLNLTLRADWLAEAAARHGHWDAATRDSFRDALRAGRLKPDESTLLCRLGCTVAGMICGRYGFSGPSFSLGAACASSMAALFTAMHLMRGGVIDAAVIGGGEEIYAPLFLAEFCALGALARRTERHNTPEECSRPFDAHRNGFVLGEGAAMLVLERESTARWRAAPLHGLITGMGGVTNPQGLVEPSAAAQLAAMRASFAGLDYGPEAVQLVECHATATIQGDLEEARALMELYGHDRPRNDLVLSAYKGQVGHSIGAAGAMALIHGLLAMRDGVFPGTRNCTEPDPAIPLEKAGLRLLTQPEEWPRPVDGIRRLQVNTFAFGGGCFTLQVEEPNDRQPAYAACPAAGAASVQTADAGLIQGFDGQETVVDGVRLVALEHQGRPWRLGSVTPAWMQEMAALSAAPGKDELSALSRRGLWLSPAEQPPPVAVMCCGQGSVWPGMGRSLYDTFPAARAAMDRIAAVADWDVLALMDETDLEKIGQTRWQQPYLFLLEYAQASYLESLGFTPAVMSGHSLGELIALCLAGVYTPEQAWYILDTRSQLVSNLEAQADHATGMMAVYAPAPVVEDTLGRFPDLRVSNYNTPTQFILSGPRQSLSEARRALRKAKFPAVLLNISMAFHHPHMRVIRPISIKRLNAVPMRPARLPMLSNVTTGLYPTDTPSISEYIADLDENAVRWVECVHNMWNTYGVRHFVEFGPADVLCGITSEIQPDAVCVPVGRKNKEVEGMRAAVARLYALGHLPRRAGRALASSSTTKAATGRLMMAASTSQAPSSVTPDAPAHVEEIMPLIMEATGYERQELTPDLDLRHDLSIRSSRFPLIMHAAESRFNITIRFEDIMGVATIRDLADVLLRLRQGASAEAEVPAVSESAPLTTPEDTADAEDTPAQPLLRYVPRSAPLTLPPPIPAAAENPGPILLVGSGEAASTLTEELRQLYAEAALLTAPSPSEALALLDGEAPPQGLVLVLDYMPEEDPTETLTTCQLLLQKFLRHRGAIFCLAVLPADGEQTSAVDQHLPAHSGFAGVTGMWLAAALEYPRVLFRSVMMPLRDGHWLARALNAQNRILQWDCTHPQTPTTPQLHVQPADPVAGLPLQPGDVLVVSGGGRGITPRALEGLAPLGCVLALLGRGAAPDSAACQRLTALGATVHYECCDITDAGAAKAALERIHARFGRIDGLLHAAGCTRDGTLENLCREDMDAVLAVKCRGLAVLLQAATPYGLRYAAAFSSLAGWLGNYGQSNYSAANRAMAAQLRRWCEGRDMPWRCIWLPPITGEGMAGSEEIREQLKLRGLEKAWIDAADMGDLLARELCACGDGDAIWARVLPAVPAVAAEAAPQEAALRGLRERPELFPLVYPLHMDGGAAPSFTGAHDFSHFSDSVLAHASRIDDQPVAPLSLLVQCLAESALQPMPWLKLAALRNVRTAAPLLCPPGVTRESCIHMRGQGWLLTEADGGKPQRHYLWAGEMEARDIAANGRRQQRWSAVCSGEALLAPIVPSLSALWPPDAPNADGLPRQIFSQEEIARFFNPRYRLCSQWLEIFQHIVRLSNVSLGRTTGFAHLQCADAPPKTASILVEARKAGEAEETISYDIQALLEDGAVLAAVARLDFLRP